MPAADNKQESGRILIADAFRRFTDGPTIDAPATRFNEPVPPTAAPPAAVTPAPTDKNPGPSTTMDEEEAIDAETDDTRDRPAASSTRTELSTMLPTALIVPRTVALAPFSTAPLVATAGAVNVSTPVPASTVVPAQPV
jgi:hypothetical protein